MLQVVQHQKSGVVSVEELPAPFCMKEGILVKTAFSLISAGTEKTSVTGAQASLIQRAKKQPEQVKTVFDNIRKEGLISTFNKVQTKLDSYKVLGYSASGIVLESGCNEFSVGDRVACAGAGIAVHAEVLTVPKNLAVKIPDGVSFEEAAYTTVASIAMQGVRQADVRLGETVAVIGLGLIGQITVQLLKASGCTVIGMDVNEELFDKALEYGCNAVYPSNTDSVKTITSLTKGIGCDAVIITASTPSNEPIDLAIKLSRKKGKVVIVGDIGITIPRSPFYEKELDIKISCSYGPGRYDSNYELLGQDYPPAYVRWTENRNMQSILELMSQKKLDVNSLTTHIVPIEVATDAYDMLTGKIEEKYLGILIKYKDKSVDLKRTITMPVKSEPKREINIGFIGAGSHAQFYILPSLKANDISLVGVSTSSPVESQSVAKKFGFHYSSTDSEELINNPAVNTVFCASWHNTHAKYVLESIKSGKPVFVEKPLAINPDELREIDEAVLNSNGRVMVGFNRRFSESFREIAKFFEFRKNPMFISYRVNAGFIPKTHWIQNPEQGGRIIGEVCHFVDCMVFLTGSKPVHIFAESLSFSSQEAIDRDNIVVTIKFSDGSTGVINYLSNGDTSVDKEYCEVFCENSIAVMNNFVSVELVRGGKSNWKRFDGKKGHREEILATIESIRHGKQMPINYEDIRAVTLTTFAVDESLSTGNIVQIEY
ncbi:MAG: oxidoreductase [Bacteroidetes bacterium]|nr:MAG: oxidoreductase [Bacteroidota bacterium]